MPHFPELLLSELVLARKKLRRALARCDGSSGKPAAGKQEVVSAARRYAQAVRRFRQEVTRGIA